MNFPTLPWILTVERALGPVLGPHIYVGGACVGFYVSESDEGLLRPTEDVDLVVEVTSDLERTALDETIRRAGLQHDMEGPICRWRLGSLVVDVMPADVGILGFANRWYLEAMRGREPVSLGDVTIYVPHVFTFLATKAEAFGDRGKGDFYMSQDFEDIVRVLDGCTFLEERISSAPPEVLDFLREKFGEWSKLPKFERYVETHVLDNEGTDRRGFVLDRMEWLIASAR